MASEIETRLEKKIVSLQGQINSLSVQLRRLHRVVTHPSARSYIEKLAREAIGIGDLVGTTNQVSVTNGTGAMAKSGTVTLNTPQNIDSGASPEFLGLMVGVGATPAVPASNHIKLWVEDANGVADKAALHMYFESGTEKLIAVGVLIKTTTGDPTQVHEGLMAINTFDNNIKMYADSAWRTLISW